MKNSYRYPLLVGLPQFYRNNLPNSIKERKVLTKSLTAMSVAIVEAFITCPVERLKVYFMTNAD